MRKTPLKNLLDECPDEAASLEVSGVCADSRKVKPGEAFFAVPGVKENGLKYVAAAAAAGACAVVHDAEEAVSAPVPVIRVADARLALARAAAAFFAHPSRSFYLAGVTGTNGKTTLTYLLESLWRPERVGVVGTVNVRYGDVVREASHTTPDPVDLAQLFADMRAAGVKKVAMEVSSHAVHQKRVSGCDFDAAIFTNLTQDHLDYHGDMESYYLAKRDFFTTLLPASAKASKLAVVNVGDAYGRRLAREARGADVVTYAADGTTADLALKEAAYSFAGTQAVLEYRGKALKLETGLIGAHNVQNVMAALAHELARGAGFEDCARRLKEVNVPGRLERVGGRNFFVDYAHTPDALRNVIDALARVRASGAVKGRIVTVFGCGGDRDRTKRPLMGAIAAEFSDVAVVTSDNPRTEDPRAIIADILRGVPGKAPSFDGARGYLVEADRARALEKAVAIARDEDIVLVAGKGHEDYQIVGTEKRHFDDREILRELLK